MHVFPSGISCCWGTAHAHFSILYNPGIGSITHQDLPLKSWLNLTSRIMTVLMASKTFRNHLFKQCELFVQVHMWEYLAFGCLPDCTLPCREGPWCSQINSSQVMSRSRKPGTSSSLFGSDVKWISSSWVWKVNLFLPVNDGSASSHYANPDCSHLPASR